MEENVSPQPQVNLKPEENPIPQQDSPLQPGDQPPIKPPELLKPKKNLKTPILIAVFLLLVSALGFFIYQNYNLRKSISQATPPPAGGSQPSPTPDPTADWKTYTNTAGYSIQYPAIFTTQLIAAGAGNKDADSTTGNLFIYKSDASEPYLERYINLEIFQDKPPYNQGTITEITLDNRTVEKIVLPDAKFDIYSAQLGNKEFIEIYVSNDPARKDLANQILSTFKFTD